MRTIQVDDTSAGITAMGRLRPAGEDVVVFAGAADQAQLLARSARVLAIGANGQRVQVGGLVPVTFAVDPRNAPALAAVANSGAAVWPALHGPG
jgi:hypothetical protein